MDSTNSCKSTQNGSTSVVEMVKEDASAQKEIKSNQFLAGIAFSVLSAFGYAITSSIVKCTTGVSMTQLALFRFFGILLMSIPVVMESGERWFGPTSWWFRLWLLLRSLTGLGNLLFTFYALQYISIANTAIVILSMPIFVFLFAHFFLGEPFSRYHAISLALSIIGIGLASKVHHLILDQPNENGFENSSSQLNSTGSNFLHISTNDYQTLTGNLYALFATISGAIMFVVIRKLTTVHHCIIQFNFSWIAMLVLLPASLVTDGALIVPTHQYTPYLIFALVCFSYYAQEFMVKALLIEEAGVVSIVKGSSEAIFSAILEIVIFNVKPDLYSIIGAILVLFSLFLLTFQKYITNLPKDSQLKNRFNFLID